MPKHFFFALMLFSTLGYAQNATLPFDFESTPVTADFIDFDGGTATVIDNPHATGDNPSAKVAQIVRDGGMVWAGSKVILAENLDFSVENRFSMKVFSPLAGITMKLKLEGTAETDRDAVSTVANQWETLTWDFTGEPANTFNTLVFMFDFGNTGDGSANSTFLFDDLVQFDPSGGLAQIDLPVTFQDPAVFYELTDFGDNSTVLGPDPTDGSNAVAITTKPTTAPLWAGTTMSTPAGFANPIPVSASATKMTVRVYSPDANIPIRLKIEDHTDPTRSVETEAIITVANAWQTLEFDFSNEAAGTAPLNLSYTYDMASIFFNFGTDGATAGEKTYYWDDARFGDLSTNTENLQPLGLTYYPNPVIDVLHIRADQVIDHIHLMNQAGQQVLGSRNTSTHQTLDLSSLPAGVYWAKVQIGGKAGTIKVIKATP